MSIASLMTTFASQPIVQHALAGIRIAVIVLIAQAVIKMFKSGVKDWFGLVLFLAIFLATYFNLLPAAGVVVIAAICGIVWQKVKKKPEKKEEENHA